MIQQQLTQTLAKQLDKSHRRSVEARLVLADILEGGQLIRKAEVILRDALFAQGKDHGFEHQITLTWHCI